MFLYEQKGANKMKILNVTPYNSVSNKTTNTSFGACFAKKVVHYKEWNWNKLRILERSDSEMIDLAEYFHKMSDHELENVAFGNKFFNKASRIQAAYDRLKKAVDTVNTKKNQMKEAVCLGNPLSNILQQEIDRLDAKADNSQEQEKLFKK